MTQTPSSTTASPSGGGIVPMRGIRAPALNAVLVPVEIRPWAPGVFSIWNGRVHRWHRGKLS